MTTNAETPEAEVPSATQKQPKYQIDLSPDEQRWTTITVVSDGLIIAREMAKTLLYDQIKNGMFHARVRPLVHDAYVYHVDAKVIESGVN